MSVRNAALSQAEKLVTHTGWTCCDGGVADGFTGHVPWPCPYNGAGCDHVCLSYGNAVQHASDYHLFFRRRQRAAA